jgi:hypothetical protein
MVKMSVAPLLASAIVTLENGVTAASEVVVWPGLVPVMVEGTAGSLSITMVVGFTVAVA